MISDTESYITIISGYSWLNSRKWKILNHSRLFAGTVYKWLLQSDKCIPVLLNSQKFQTVEVGAIGMMESKIYVLTVGLK